MTTEPDPLDHPVDEGGGRGRGPNDLRFSPWNLLLLIPLLMLITAWYNHDGPRLFGMPFFYWFQFVWVIIGVASVWIVYLMTRHDRGRTAVAGRAESGSAGQDAHTQTRGTQR